jgi:hypothetical protein
MVHNDVTLKILQAVLNQMEKLQEVSNLHCFRYVLCLLPQSLKDQLTLNLNITKHHILHMHFIPSIWDNGPLCNTDTNYGKACHPQSKKDYSRWGSLKYRYISLNIRYVHSKLTGLPDAEEGCTS